LLMVLLVVNAVFWCWFDMKLQLRQAISTATSVSSKTYSSTLGVHQ